jgi:hypothetical protein
MNALITVDLEHVHPVIDGRWHHAQLESLPQTGDMLTTLCGITEPVQYRATQDQVMTVHTCWDCDAIYRQLNGMPNSITT